MHNKNIKILDLLKRNSKLTTSQISKKTGIPITTVHNRIKKMEKEGIIKHYTLDLDYNKLNLPLQAHVLVTAFNTTPNGKKVDQEIIAKQIKKHEHIERVQIITGGYDLLVTIRASSMKELNELITKFIRQVDGVDKTTTMMVMDEV